MIDASPGLGEAVVSGAVNPDHFVVDTPTGEIRERRLGDKRVVIEGTPGGGTRRVEREAHGEEACLTDTQVRELARLGATVEAHYQAPQDTEWAIDAAGKLWLTQARPITTLYPLPARAPVDDDALRVYLSFNVEQGVNRPLTPRGIAATRLIVSGVARVATGDGGHPDTGPSFLKEAGMRLFVDIPAALRHPFGRPLARFLLGHGEARSAALIDVLRSDPRLVEGSTGRGRFAWRAISTAVRLRVPVYLLGAILRPQAARRRVLGLQHRLDRMVSVPPDATAEARLDRVEEVARQGLFRIGATVVPVLAAGFGAFGLAGKLLGDLATPDERQAVLRSVPFNPTTEMDLALWSVAREIRADEHAATFMRAASLKRMLADYRQGTLPPVIQRRLTTFLPDYGHRGVAEIDLGLPRWADDPTHILGALVNYLHVDDPNLAPDDLFSRGADQARAMIWELTTRAMRRGWLRGWLVNLCLGRTRALVGMREQPKFYFVWTLARMRELLRPVAAELVRARRLEEADDLYFLSFAEARAALAGTDMRALVRERRAIYEQELRRPHIPRVLLSDGTVPTMPAAEGDAAGTLHGSPASAGRVTATARVSVTRSARAWSRARSSSRPRLIQVGPRSSSQRVAWSWDGRSDVTWRSGRPRVRHTGGRRRGRRNRAHPDRTNDHG